MVLHRWLPALVTAVCLAPAPTRAQEPAPIVLETYSLPNGLKVILAPDRTTQVVAVDVWYDVGSRNETRGRTGFAHLFEHMMFQGSANVKKAEHFQLVERAGGNMNGSTSEDRTNYYEVLPSNRLNLGLWLEADRMRSLAITDSNFTNQREAVKEERRLRVDNQPYASSYFDGIYALADSASCFPYAHSIIGSMDDLNAAKTEDVQAFFDLYYTPNNAILTVVGDFDTAEAKRLIEQYFGEIPRGQTPPPVECAPGYGAGAIRKAWPDPRANLPGVLLALARVPEHEEDQHRQDGEHDDGERVEDHGVETFRGARCARSRAGRPKPLRIIGHRWGASPVAPRPRARARSDATRRASRRVRAECA